MHQDLAMEVCVCVFVCVPVTSCTCVGMCEQACMCSGGEVLFSQQDSCTGLGPTVLSMAEPRALLV